MGIRGVELFSGPWGGNLRDLEDDFGAASPGPTMWLWVETLGLNPKALGEWIWGCGSRGLKEAAALDYGGPSFGLGRVVFNLPMQGKT